VSSDKKNPAEELRELVGGESQADSEPSSEDESPRRNRRYTPAEHKLAYEIWRHTNNYSQAARQLDTSQAIIKRWSDKKYRCKFNCKWHGWDDLKRAELLRVDRLATDDTQLEEGQFWDEGNTSINLSGLLRSDEERLNHLELLYTKAYFLATHMLPDSGLIGNERGQVSRQELIEVFSSGAQTKSFDVALKAVLQLTDKINEYKERLGVRRKSGQKPVVDENLSELTIEDLNKLRNIWEGMDEEKRRILMKMFTNEGRAANILGLQKDEDEKNGDKS